MVHFYFLCISVFFVIFVMKMNCLHNEYMCVCMGGCAQGEVCVLDLTSTFT